MNRRLIILGLTGVLLSGSAGAGDEKKPAASLDFTGRVEATESVDLRARATGYLVKINFKAGDDVQKGQVLFEIDDRPYKAALATAEATVKLAEAVIPSAERNMERGKRLLEAKAMSREEYETLVAAEKEAKAKLLLAMVEREVARINVDFTRITAPISGKIGEARLTAGNLVKADDTTLAFMDSTGPRYIYFNVDVKTATQLRMLPVAVTLRSANDKKWEEGKLDFVDNRVVPETGTVRCRAVFPNADGTLLPGMLVRVRVPVAAKAKDEK